MATQRALSYLESRVATTTDNYILSIITYALKLANSTMFTTAFDKLNRNSVMTGMCSCVCFQIHLYHKPYLSHDVASGSEIMPFI